MRIPSAQNLKARYGITQDQYKEMLREQGNMCRICLVPFGKEITPCVDHCHTKSHVRGLLCNHCNLAIGHFYDSPELLTRARQYLEENYYEKANTRSAGIELPRS